MPCWRFCLQCPACHAWREPKLIKGVCIWITSSSSTQMYSIWSPCRHQPCTFLCPIAWVLISAEPIPCYRISGHHLTMSFCRLDIISWMLSCEFSPIVVGFFSVSPWIVGELSESHEPTTVMLIFALIVPHRVKVESTGDNHLQTFHAH